MTAAVPLPVLVPAGGGDCRQRRDRLELLSALISGPGFDPLLRGDIIAFPRDHPVFWWGCRITGCERPRRENKMLCAGHEAQCRQACLAGADRAAWMRDAAPLARAYARVPEPCQICGHRPAIRGGSRLCARHQQRWKKARRKAGSPGFEEWLAAQVPYDSFGGCRVAVCPELAYSPLGLCHGHESAYRFQGSPGGARLPGVWFGRFEQAGQPVPVCYDNEAGFGRWCRAALPLPRPGTVNLRGLAPLARAEIQWGLHAHAQAAEHAGWSLGWVQAIADACRGLNCLADLDTSQFDHTVRNAMTEMLAALRLVYLTPAETREAGYLEFGHFGAEPGSRRGRFDLTAIRQRWLRDLLWDYTAAQLRSPQAPRSRGSYHNARQACVTLSGFLEARAPGGGHQPGLLSDEHAFAFAADLRHRAANGLPALGLSRADGKPSLISDRSRNTILNYIRKILRHALDTGDADRIGLDRGFIVALPHGGPMTQRTRRPFTDETARALADPGNLARLAGTFDPSDRGIRDIWETIVATGRRCSEITSLRLDCVGRYGGLPLLWHDQAKVGNYDEAIRIPEYIYQRITERQRKTLDRFEHHHGRPPDSAERARLALFPSPVRNLHGTRAISYYTFQSRFRQWVDQLDLGVSCVAHQARHTLATRLLAHGAGLHHIRRYLGHVSIRMTEHYAKVATSEIEDILQHIWVAGPAAPNPGELLSDPATPMDRRQAEALMIDLSRASTPTEGGFCTYQPVVHGGACPWNLNCHSCDKFVLSGADLLYWLRKREQWASIAERAPDDATADYLHQVFAPTALAIDGLEKALAGLGLLDQALALDLRRPQDYYHRLWNMSFRATDLAAATGSEAEEEGR
jgi:integrase